jgi:RNA polymerase sigma factor (sigma-70 family)
MSPIVFQDDALLWRQLKEGDASAFEALYRKYIGALLQYGERMGLQEEVLKDQVQDLFVEIWKSRTRVSPTDNVKFYLFKALRYKMMRYSQRSNQAIPLNEEWPVSEESVESRLLVAEQEGLMANHLLKAMEKLPKRQQEIIHLRFFQGFSNQEIADLLNMQYQSASNLIHRSLQSMRQYLQSPAISL